MNIEDYSLEDFETHQGENFEEDEDDFIWNEDESEEDLDWEEDEDEEDEDEGDVTPDDIITQMDKAAKIIFSTDGLDSCIEEGEK